MRYPEHSLSLSGVAYRTPYNAAVSNSTFIPGHSTRKVNIFMATLLLQQTTIVATYDIISPAVIGGPKGVPA